MDNLSYWLIQTKKPLFNDIDTEKPEQKQFAGKLAILGGNKSQFFSAISSAETATKLGVGEVKVILPDSLKGKIPTLSNIDFLPAELSGGFDKNSRLRFSEIIATSEYLIVIGDLGKNSTTAIAVNEFIKSFPKGILLTRDSIDLVTPDAANWIEQGNITLLSTLPQLQKLFRSLFYPKIITLSMPTNQLIETLHKFTISYPTTIITLHNKQIIIAKDGTVVTTEISETPYNPLSFWSGALATKISTLSIWNKNNPLHAAATAILQ